MKPITHNGRLVSDDEIQKLADQAKAVKSAVEAKNNFHHNLIFRGIVLSNVSIPEWLGLNLSAANYQ